MVADRLGRNCVGIELNKSYAEMAERLDPRLDRKFRKAAPADRIVVDVARADRLEAVSAHRRAAARIEAPRRRDLALVLGLPPSRQRRQAPRLRGCALAGAPVPAPPASALSVTSQAERAAR